MNPEASQTASIDPHRRVNAARVCELCGGVSDMSLWRWLNDPALSFPKPIYIARRRYWREAEVIAWLEAREVAA
ncbi:helix-turn-helix transcriptional regulator [Psychromarinibacter sp. S121]|uniref:helix-turn-helix transcriptional regulator n=1 Tax=Psychromarinibacter sp. S121 TaxID=3415127 RepID=UPI003C7B668C